MANREQLEREILVWYVEADNSPGVGFDEFDIAAQFVRNNTWLVSPRITVDSVRPAPCEPEGVVNEAAWKATLDRARKQCRAGWGQTFKLDEWWAEVDRAFAPLYDMSAPAVCAPQPEAEADTYALESVAHAIYNHMPYEGNATKPDWVQNGNALKQDEARAYARAAPLTVAPVSVVEEIRHAKREAFGAHHKCGASGCTETAEAWSRKCAEELDAALAKIVTLPEPSEWAKSVAKGLYGDCIDNPEDALEVAAALIAATEVSQ